MTLLAEIRAAQEELGNRIDRRAGCALRENAGGKSYMASSTAEPAAFPRRLGNDRARGEPRATHRRPKRRYTKRVRMPSKLDLHVALIEGWLAAEPQLTAIAIVRRLKLYPDHFGKKQHSIVQRLLRALRKSAANRLIAATPAEGSNRRTATRGCGRLELCTARPAHSPSLFLALKIDPSADVLSPPVW